MQNYIFIGSLLLLLIILTALLAQMRYMGTISAQ